MTAHIYRRIETIQDPRGLYAGIYHSMSGKTARIEIWTADTPARGERRFRSGRRLDTRRCSPPRAESRARELLDFWAGGRQPD